MSANTRLPEIDIAAEAGDWDAGAEKTVRRALEAAAATIGKDFRNHAVAVLLTDNAAIRKLNAQWRGLDKPTNVLSFPAAKVPGAAVASLGDIAIAYETTAREAAEEGKPFGHHLSHLAVHGFLHLLGHDHESDRDAETMEQLERVVLARIGVPDPYREASPREAARV